MKLPIIASLPMSKNKIKLGIFFGGISPEHTVSLSSAKGIIDNVNREKFKVVEIYINKKGKFYIGTDALKKVVTKNIRKLKKLDINNLPKLIDVAFPVLHGEGGEDGTIQGLFESLNVPCVGCDVSSSVICLDKVFFNQIMAVNKIKQSKFEFLDYEYENNDEINAKIQIIKKNFTPPLFIKSARTGSSVGVYKVTDLSLLEKYINKSRKFDTKVVVEVGVKNAIEVEVSVMGNNDGNIKASLPGRVLPGAEFYDFNDKYNNNLAKFEIPVNFSKMKIKELQSLAIKAYKLTNCKGLARVDFLLDSRLNININEINTLPGFTPVSMYPKLWEVSGLSYSKLLTNLVLLALKA
jgi:D-alanine-D-alanine ligase